MTRAASKGVSLELPVDHVVAASLKSTESRIVPVTATPADQMGLDIGPETVRKYSAIIAAAKTIGPAT
jgi:phosphoglycerate kinase